MRRHLSGREFLPNFLPPAAYPSSLGWPRLCARKQTDEAEFGDPGTDPGQEEARMTDETKYLSTCRAAKHLGLSPRTLDRYRVTGGGPVYHLFGTAVRYLKEDLDEWARTRRRRSTSDDGSGPRPAPAGANR